MKNLARPKYSLCLLAFLFWFALAPRFGYAGANEVTFDGHPISWSTKSPISYMVNPNCAAENPNCTSGLTSDLQKLLVVGAVDEAFRSWANIPGASIHFSNGGTTQLTGAAADGVNVISFQDPNNTHTLPPGVVAVTVTSFATSIGNVQLGNKTITVDFVGQILDADIIFNPRITFSPIGANNSADLVAILTHEIGHLLGLDHTGVLSSIMDPFGEAGTAVASRALQSDDMLTAASIYPDPAFAPAPGTISGTITSASGAPVKSADVIAISVPGGVPVASQLSGADGTFRIAGLSPANYQVMVEPFDGPIRLSNFPGFYSTGQTNFATTFLGSSGNPTTITVTSGQSTTANVTVPAPPPNFLNIDTMAGVLQSQSNGAFTLSPSPLFLPRGNAYQLILTGTNLGTDSNFRFSAPALDITPQGTTTSDTLVGGQTVREQNITISNSAALGPSNLSLVNFTSTSAMPGGVVVTVSPNVISPIKDGAGFGTTLAPGTIFSIFGSDLAFGRGSGGVEFWNGPPAPTRLGGISVKVGDRYAPLFFVSPTQINGMIPYEVTGSSTTVTIETGPNAAGNTLTVSLSPTAPGIFFATDSAGKTHGAILNGADNTLAAPTVSFPGAHPARPGSVIVIFAAGLGPVSPSLPSGVGSGANGTPIPQLVRSPQVLIGGQPVPGANFQFYGLAPGFVGLYQVNVQLPANATGDAVPVQIVTAEGQTSNSVTMAVSP